MSVKKRKINENKMFNNENRNQTIFVKKNSSIITNDKISDKLLNNILINTNLEQKKFPRKGKNVNFFTLNENNLKNLEKKLENNKKNTIEEAFEIKSKFGEKIKNEQKKFYEENFENKKLKKKDYFLKRSMNE